MKAGAYKSGPLAYQRTIAGSPGVFNEHLACRMGRGVSPHFFRPRQARDQGVGVSPHFFRQHKPEKSAELTPTPPSKTRSTPARWGQHALPSRLLLTGFVERQRGLLV